MLCLVLYIKDPSLSGLAVLVWKKYSRVSFKWKLFNVCFHSPAELPVKIWQEQKSNSFCEHRISLYNYLLKLFFDLFWYFLVCLWIKGLFLNCFIYSYLYKPLNVSFLKEIVNCCNQVYVISCYWKYTFDEIVFCTMGNSLCRFFRNWRKPM